MLAKKTRADGAGGKILRAVRPILLDAGERLIIFCLFVLLSARMVQSFLQTGDWFNLLLLASEGLIALFMLIRRYTPDISIRVSDWLLAFSATVLPLLVRPGGDIFMPQFGVAMLVTGALFQLYAKLTLWRSFGIAPANRGLKREGPYRVVRHPMYSAYIVSHIGFLLLNMSLWNGVVYLAAAALQLLRMRAEEKLLAHDPGFQAFREAVPYKLVPGIY